MPSTKEKESNIQKNFESKISEQIKACIHCGMCLPACPSYQTDFNEANSPRGRIYLINDLLQGQDEEEKQTKINYLDNCLSCYACETVCPSNVDYEGILHYARKELDYSNYNKGFYANLRKIFFQFFIRSRSLLRFTSLVMELFSPVIKTLMSLTGFGKQAKLMPRFEYNYKALTESGVYTSKLDLDIPDERRTLNLSLGCVMDTIYNRVHWDTIEVLNAFGYHVLISKSKCCGSLASHSGEFELGAQMKEDFSKTVKEEKYPLLINSAGCGAFLKEDKSLKTLDFIEAIKKAPFNPLEGKKFPAQIIYHPACHLNHRQGISNLYEELLQSIKGLEILTLDQKDICCGSAGFYNLIKAESAEKIGKSKVEQFKSLDCPILVTANPGCMSQIKAYLPKDYQVLHPASFLWQVLS